MTRLKIPGLPPAFIEAMQLHRAGRMPEAIRAYKLVLAGAPGYEPALANLAEITARQCKLAQEHWHGGDNAAADAALQLAFQADDRIPRDAGRLFRLAAMALDAQQADPAISLLRKALEIAPKNLSLYYQLAFAQSRDGTWRAAAVTMRQGIEHVTGWGPVDMQGCPIRQVCDSEGTDFPRRRGNHYVALQPAWTEEYGDFRLLIIEPDGSCRWMALPAMPHSESFAAALEEVDLVGAGLMLSKDVVRRLLGYNAIGGNFELRHLMWLATHIEQSSPNAITLQDLPHGAVAFASDVSSNYYHWLFDNLSRMARIERFPELRGLPIIYPGHGLPFVRETLEMLEWPGQLIPIAPGINRFPLLYVPSRSWADDFGGISVQDVLWLRARFGRYRETQGRPRRVFISRGAAPRRRITNEEALSARLASLGFVSVRLESLPVREQIALFAAAEIIVAPHGAGLTNLVYSPEGAIIVELASSGTELNHLYGAVSAAISGRHAILRGVPSGSVGGKPISPDGVDAQMRSSLQLEEDYIIEEEALLGALKTLGAAL